MIMQGADDGNTPAICASCKVHKGNTRVFNDFATTLGVATVAAGLLVWLFKQDARPVRRLKYQSYRYGRGGDPKATAELPAVETMSDVVWGKRT